jgi:hypothetical protein
MSEARDERPLDQIQFAIDELDLVKRAQICEAVRTTLATVAGVTVAQDIVDLGCTGLVLAFSRGSTAVTAIGSAQYIRANMGGSLCGLPCYVPPDRFCLVHNGIGSLQTKGNLDGAQVNPHPEGLALCSRELTEIERKYAMGVDALIDANAAHEAGASDRENEALHAEVVATPTALALGDGFTCPEHRDPEFRCRFCLAAAVINGDFEPTRLVMIHDGKSQKFVPGAKLDEVLASDDFGEAELYVRAARWVRRLIRE